MSERDSPWKEFLDDYLKALLQRMFGERESTLNELAKYSTTQLSATLATLKSRMNFGSAS